MPSTQTNNNNMKKQVSTLESKAIAFVSGCEAVEEMHFRNAKVLRELFALATMDIVATAEAVATAWKNHGTLKQAPIRPICEACFAADLDYKEATSFLVATNLVSKGRISQILRPIYGKDTKSRDPLTDLEKLELALKRFEGKPKSEITAARKLVSQYL